jgi:hypothetical protein
VPSVCNPLDNPHVPVFLSFLSVEAQVDIAGFRRVRKLAKREY